jgi:small subunit ribosomal protein S1
LIKNVLTSEEPLQGVVKKVVSYGLFVEAGGVEGLVHFTEISHKGAVNPAQYYNVGDEVVVKAVEYNKDKKRASFSIKAASSDPWDTVKQELEPGDAVKAAVSNIENYGAFLDLGNDIEGFLHISEISWQKNIKHPSELLEVGQEVTAEIIEIDLKNRRLRLSMKRLTPKPFDDFKNRNRVGDLAKGEVTGLTDFGAFIKIGEIEGLLHNEDFSWDRNIVCKENLKVGDSVEVKIIKIDPEKEKVSLSVKELGLNPVEQYGANNPIGTSVKGIVRDIKDFGVFVRLAPGVDALIRAEDLFPKKIEEITAGDEIEAAISLFDPPKIRLSQRKLQKDRERNLIKDINNKNSGFNNAFREKLRS